MERDALFLGDSELAGLMRQKRWDDTALGPVGRWPNGLRAAVRIVLTSRFAMWMAWGDELTFFYNDAYRRATLGSKHPRSLGAPTSTVWSEIWDDIGPRVASVLSEGRATWDEGLLLFLERDGYSEETYHTFSYSPLHDDDGKVRGVLCVVVEETSRVLSERRVGLLGKLASELAGSTTTEAALAGLERTLGADARDFPFSLTYLFDGDGDAEAARLAAHTGVTGGHAMLTSSAGAWRLGDLGAPREVELEPGDWPQGPWPRKPVRALVLPLADQGQARARGALVVGLNPHRAFDAAYREFALLFAAQLASGLANARAYEDARARAEALAALDRAKTTFFSNVSHELRTPLTLMLAPLGGLLEDADTPAPLRDELSTVHHNAQRLLKLVNTLLDFSRLEAGRTSANLESVELGSLTADLSSVFRAATEKAGIELVVDSPPLSAPVLVDRDMWEKIVLNLVSNAFKFTLEGKIEVSLSELGDAIELVVRDTGTGIPERELPLVFNRFHRVEGSRGRTHEGTGIGLALVQELVRLHGGNIAVSSEVERGTTFTVSIPAVRSDHHSSLIAAQDAPTRAHAFVQEALRWLPDAPQSTPPGPLGESTLSRRVLVADDNADMRAYMRRLLSPRWQVETVANGREALEAIRRERPDLVLSDVMMPELDGFGLLLALRADAELSTLPFIMLSARAGEEARIEGLRAGANDYLVKPFVARELLARAETQLWHAMLSATERENARRLEAIFQKAPVAISILRGPTHVFEIANERYRKISGRENPIGRTVAEVSPEAAEQGFVALLDRVYQSGERFVAEAQLIRLNTGAGGAPVDYFFDILYEPLADVSGKVTGIAAIGYDVTATVAARRSAEAANTTKDEFLAMLGHELRNPLAPIATALELMRTRPNVGAERERAVIERQVQHLVRLVDDLLDVSRITRGKVELRREPLSLTEVVGQAAETVSPLFEQRQHALRLSVPDDLRVDADRARLTQVLSNLLANAAKYTPNGGHVEVSAERDGDEVRIEVRDDGIGIEPGMLERVFEPFAQGRQPIDRAQGGLGLGLAIADNLLKLHGGSIKVESAGPAKGSTFTVRLPLSEASPRPSLAPGPKASPAARRSHILIVDDNIDAAEMLAAFLDASGFRTSVAHDGPEALALSATATPEIAILDLGLPVMDGYELARQLLARPGAPKLVALTGYGQADDRKRTAEVGFSVHLVKPVELSALRDTIDRLLECE